MRKLPVDFVAHFKFFPRFVDFVEFLGVIAESRHVFQPARLFQIFGMMVVVVVAVMLWDVIFGGTAEALARFPNAFSICSERSAFETCYLTFVQPRSRPDLNFAKLAFGLIV